MGAGLAVVPLIGLLESIAVAKAFGKMPPACPSASARHSQTGTACPCVYAYVYVCLHLCLCPRTECCGWERVAGFSFPERLPSEVFSVVTGSYRSSPSASQNNYRIDANQELLSIGEAPCPVGRMAVKPVVAAALVLAPVSSGFTASAPSACSPSMPCAFPPGDPLPLVCRPDQRSGLLLLLLPGHWQLRTVSARATCLSPWGVLAEAEGPVGSPISFPGCGRLPGRASVARRTQQVSPKGCSWQRRGAALGVDEAALCWAAVVPGLWAESSCIGGGCGAPSRPRGGAKKEACSRQACPRSPQGFGVRAGA